MPDQLLNRWQVNELSDYVVSGPLDQLNLGSTIMDFGHGKGRHAMYFAYKGVKVVGVENEDSLVRMLSRVSGANVRSISYEHFRRLTNNPFERSEYSPADVPEVEEPFLDGVVNWRVMSRVVDRNESEFILRKTSSMMKPGAILVCSLRPDYDRMFMRGRRLDEGVFRPDKFQNFIDAPLDDRYIDKGAFPAIARRYYGPKGLIDQFEKHGLHVLNPVIPSYEQSGHGLFMNSYIYFIAKKDPLGPNDKVIVPASHWKDILGNKYWAAEDRREKAEQGMWIKSGINITEWAKMMKRLDSTMRREVRSVAKRNEDLETITGSE